MHKSTSPLATRSFRRDKLSWAFTLLAFLFVGGYGFYWHNNPENNVPPVIENTSYNPRILVLALDRIVNKDNGSHVSAPQLKSHLTTLSNHGFEPVTVKDLHNFYYNNGKLPEKPVLLTFDFGYMDSYTLAHPVLVQTGWRAAVSLTTNKQQQQDTHYLYWDRLQRMLNSGYWEILTHGNRSDENIIVNDQGESAPFVSSPIWFSEFNRIESAEQFRSRISNDILQSTEIIKSELGVDVLAYIYRYGSPERVFKNQQYLEAEKHSRENATPLAFIDDDFGVNDHSSNPHDLRRLRVSAQWSARTFMQRVQTALSFPNPGRTGIPSSKHWVNVEGESMIDSNTLDLKGSPRSMTWLSGSQWQDSWTLRARIKVHEGDFWLVQNGVSGAQWRFGGNNQGLYLKQINQDSSTNMLQSSDKKVNNGWHELKLVRRGAGVWAEWDGTPLWSQPIYLPNEVNGPIGWLTWSELGDSHVEIKNTRVDANTYTAKVTPPFPSAKDVKSLINYPEKIAALSPTQFTLDDNKLHEHNIDSDLFKLLQHRYGWQLMPTVKFSSSMQSASVADHLLQTLLARANTENWGGLHLDLSELPRFRQKTITDTLDKTNQLLQREKRHLLITQAVDQTPQALQPKITQFAAAQQ